MQNRKLGRLVRRSQRVVTISQAIKAFALKVIANQNEKMSLMRSKNMVAIAELEAVNAEIATAQNDNDILTGRL